MPSFKFRSFIPPAIRLLSLLLVDQAEEVCETTWASGRVMVRRCVCERTLSLLRHVECVRQVHDVLRGACVHGQQPGHVHHVIVDDLGLRRLQALLDPVIDEVSFGIVLVEVVEVVVAELESVGENFWGEVLDGPFVGQDGATPGVSGYRAATDAVKWEFFEEVTSFVRVDFGVEDAEAIDC